MPKATEGPEEVEEAQPKEGEQITIAFLPLEDATPLYSNHMQILVSPWDLTFRFGVVTLAGDHVGAKEVARVILSPQHAKAALRLFERQMRVYEERHGEIPDLSTGVAVMEIMGS